MGFGGLPDGADRPVGGDPLPSPPVCALDLMGIAGEDDIDAPDLNAPTTTSSSGAGKPTPTGNGGPLNGPRHKRACWQSFRKP
jgi:hypothetical protein